MNVQYESRYRNNCAKDDMLNNFLRLFVFLNVLPVALLVVLLE